MNSGLKQRLVGAVVLVAIAVIFVPTFLRDRQVEPVSTKTLIPDRPAPETVTFEEPEAPEDIEPAPRPDTMFLPDEAANAAPDVEEAEAENVEEAELTEPQTAPQPQESQPQESSAEDAGTSQSQAADGRAWVIQVASFRAADSAQSLRDRLQQQGYRAYIRSANTSAGEVSRVFIGPKISRSEAEATKAEVDEALKVDALIMRFEP